MLFNRSAGCLAQPNLATRTINFIQSLPTTEGNPAKLMGWQQRFIRDLLKVNKGKRQIRNALLSCGRKNGKTGLASYLMLAHLFGALKKRGTRLYSVANDRAQAALVFDELEGIILQCPTWGNTTYNATTSTALRVS